MTTLTGTDTDIRSLNELQQLLKKETSDKPWTTAHFKEMTEMTNNQEVLRMIFLTARTRVKNFDDSLDIIVIASKIKDDNLAYNESIKSARGRISDSLQPARLIKMIESSNGQPRHQATICNLQAQAREMQAKGRMNLGPMAKFILNSISSFMS